MSRENLATCPACEGDGNCAKCYGDGWIYSSRTVDEDGEPVEITCPDCDGDGICGKCYGSGTLDGDEGSDLQDRSKRVNCPECDGTGRMIINKGPNEEVANCWRCEGAGTIFESDLAARPTLAQLRRRLNAKRRRP